MPLTWGPSKPVPDSNPMPNGAEGVSGTLFDGTNARRRTVRVGWDDNGLVLRDEDAGRGGIAPETIGGNRVGWAQLNFIDAPPGERVYGHVALPGWRLKLPADAPDDLADRLPRPYRFGGWIDRVGLGKAVAGLALASALLVGVVVTAPRWLGPLVPYGVERRIGDQVVVDLSPYACSTPASDAALARLVNALDHSQTDRGLPPVRVQLIKLDMVNAVAVPGARVLVFDGLVQSAKSPDELAGVIGHEIGHVRKRHVMQAMLREFGLSALMSGVQSSVGSTLGQLTEMGYSREAEGEADDWSRARLRDADISPIPTADFFARLAAKDQAPKGTVLDYFASHPEPGKREAAFRASAIPGHTYHPALDKAQFDAITGACKLDHKAKSWTPF